MEILITRSEFSFSSPLLFSRLFLSLALKLSVGIITVSPFNYNDHLLAGNVFFVHSCSFVCLQLCIVGYLFTVAPSVSPTGFLNVFPSVSPTLHVFT